ncbi:MAG: IS3 family transposase [Pseudonocardiaceae bacterium]
MATRRRFTQDYKDQAVSLHLDSGRSIAEVARSIGVHEMTLGHMGEESERQRAGPGQGSVRDRASRAGTAPQGQRRPENGAGFRKKSGSLVREGTAVKYAAIADWADKKEFPVTFMCERLGVVRQGYYRWRAEGPCERERTDAELTETIRNIHRDPHGHPGVRRVWAELLVRGVRVAAKRVWRLMKAAGPRGRHPRVWKKTTVAGQRPIDAPDLIGQNFTAADPNTRWCGDITYVRTVDGWAYTATVIDPHSRKVVGYAVADHLRTSLIIEALTAALVTRKPPDGVIFHSDHGCQYTSKEFAEFCAINGVRRSMGRRATCYDNAVSESFFATYKKELIHTRPWNDLTDVRQQTFLWVEGYYNRRRRHSTLGYLTPTEYELGYRKLTDLAA